MNQTTTIYSKPSHQVDLESLDFLDEDSINQQAYLEQFERDLSMGFPRYLSPKSEPIYME